ncbi:hypothetical protein Bbelb_153470 [Branchiostoma belcheri]|nr:hypothetical protein Bbelb_153470 [Branchiostoma belcheri]
MSRQGQSRSRHLGLSTTLPMAAILDKLSQRALLCISSKKSPAAAIWDLFANRFVLRECQDSFPYSQNKALSYRFVEGRTWGKARQVIVPDYKVSREFRREISPAVSSYRPRCQQVVPFDLGTSLP